MTTIYLSLSAHVADTFLMKSTVVNIIMQLDLNKIKFNPTFWKLTPANQKQMNILMLEPSSNYFYEY